MPRADELFDRLAGNRFFTKIDLRSGYHQICVATEDQSKTTFWSRFGLYEFSVMPFGLTSAPATFRTMMNDIFRDILEEYVLVYLNDILVYSRTLEDHLRQLRDVLQRVRKHGFYAKLSKCRFVQHKVDFLGHYVFEQSLHMDDAKITAIVEWPVPTSVKQLRSFLGLTSYYSNFIRGYARNSYVLTSTLLQKNLSWFWTPLCEDVFRALKKAVTCALVLRLPDFDRPFIITTYASDFAVGVVLSQVFPSPLDSPYPHVPPPPPPRADTSSRLTPILPPCPPTDSSPVTYSPTISEDGSVKARAADRPIAFYSRPLLSAEINYTADECELKADMRRKFRGCFFGPCRTLHAVSLDTAASSVNFHVKLPDYLRGACVHDVYHGSLLRPYRIPSERFARHPYERPPPIMVDGHEEFVISDIISHRVTDNTPPRIEYLVRWRGYPDEEATWEPLEHLEHARMLVCAYDRDRRDETSAPTQSTDPLPPPPTEEIVEDEPAPFAAILQQQTDASARPQRTPRFPRPRGGAVFIDDSFPDCSGDGGGRAFFLNINFYSNKAMSGGAVYLNTGKNGAIGRFRNVQFENNIAKDSGGAVFMSPQSTGLFYGVKFNRNIAQSGHFVSVMSSSRATFSSKQRAEASAAARKKREAEAERLRRVAEDQRQKHAAAAAKAADEERVQRREILFKEETALHAQAKDWQKEAENGDSVDYRTRIALLLNRVTDLLATCIAQQEDIHSLDHANQALTKRIQQLLALTKRIQQLEQRPVATSSAGSSDLVDRINVLEIDVGTLKTVACTDMQCAACNKTETQRLDRQVGAAATPSSAPHESIPKFEGLPISCDASKTKPIPWWRQFELKLDIHHVVHTNRHAYLYSRSGGACQAWLDNMLSAHACTISELHNFITWADPTAAWKKRFQVEPPQHQAMDKLLTFAQNSMPSGDRISEFQRLESTPKLPLNLDGIKLYFIKRSCPALQNALTQVVENLNTSEELFNKAAQIIVTNLEAKNIDRSSTAGQGAYQNRPKVVVVAAAAPNDPSTSNEAASSAEGDRLAAAQNGLLSSVGKQAKGVEESSTLSTTREAEQSVAGPSKEPESNQQPALEARTDVESKAAAVQVLYTEPWEETKEVDFHSHLELIFFKLLINCRYIRVLIDNGSTTNLFSPNGIRKAGLGMKQVELQNPCQTQVGNQEVVTSTHAVKGVRVTFDKDHTVTHELNFYVMDKCAFDAVIGLGWLKAYCLRTTWADNQFVMEAQDLPGGSGGKKATDRKRFPGSNRFSAHDLLEDDEETFAEDPPLDDDQEQGCEASCSSSTYEFEYVNDEESMNAFKKTTFKTFQALKEALVNHSVLHIADRKLTFVVTTDASLYGIGAVLQQDDDDGLRPLEYYSKHMPSHKHKKGCYNRVADALSRHPQYMTCLVGSYDLRKNLKEELIEHTAKDPELSPILEQIQVDPSSQPDFHECKSLLFLRYGKHDRLCVPNHESILTHFLDLAHDRSGHFGFEKTYGSLLQKFVWLGMKGMTRKFVAECEVCQRIKPSQQKPYWLLHPLPIPDGPGESLSIDFTDMGKKSRNGYSQVMVIFDRFSKFMNLIPLPPHAPTDLVIKEFHKKYILQCGPPKTLVTDRDTKFISADWKDFTSQIYDIKLKMTFGRHPEANGLAEEINQTVIQLFRALIVPDQNSWDEELSIVQGLYNNSIHPSTEITPNRLHLGWEIRNPLSYLFPEQPCGLTPGQPGYSAKFDRLLKVVVAVMEKRRSAMIKHANKKRQPDPFTMGSYVWVNMSEFSEEEGVSRKLLPQYYGPWKVLNRVGDDSFGPSYTIDVWAKVGGGGCMDCRWAGDGPQMGRVDLRWAEMGGGGREREPSGGAQRAAEMCGGGRRWADVRGGGRSRRRCADVGEGRRRWAEGIGIGVEIGKRKRTYRTSGSGGERRSAEVGEGRRRSAEVGGGGRRGSGSGSGSGSGRRWAKVGGGGRRGSGSGSGSGSGRPNFRIGSGEKRKWREPEVGGGGGELATWRSCHVAILSRGRGRWRACRVANFAFVGSRFGGGGRRSAEVGEGRRRWAKVGGGDRDREAGRSGSGEKRKWEGEVANLPRDDLATWRSCHVGGGGPRWRACRVANFASVAIKVRRRWVKVGGGGRRRAERIGIEIEKRGEVEVGRSGSGRGMWRTCHVVGDIVCEGSCMFCPIKPPIVQLAGNGSLEETAPIAVGDSLIRSSVGEARKVTTLERVKWCVSRLRLPADDDDLVARHSFTRPSFVYEELPSTARTSAGTVCDEGPVVRLLCLLNKAPSGHRDGTRVAAGSWQDLEQGGEKCGDCSSVGGGHVMSHRENDDAFEDESVTFYRVPLQPDHIIAYALYRWASGETYESSMSSFGIGRASGLIAVEDVTRALLRVYSDKIVWPTGMRRTLILRAFEAKGFPNCYGCIDCTHVYVDKPANAPSENYFDRKHRFSVVAQVVVDLDLRITDVFVGYPGSCHDIRVLQLSSLWARADEGNVFRGAPVVLPFGVTTHGYILGDNGYPPLEWIVVPYGGTDQIPDEERFDNKPKVARGAVERAFGRLKGLWRPFLRTHKTNMDTLPQKFQAVCILHNILLDAGMEFDNNLLWEVDANGVRRRVDLGLDHPPHPIAENFNRPRALALRRHWRSG
ncbi:hypothetical protein CBR_g39970 [Chara braunii]|uniref:Reverse transcriptase n=1 Tax=Chara braunii TaxID=69332 RepID=A0A388K1S1_CHABU|nr:hypothetical protein CBR_g39970 [Chara braunii]|eukprot:GBG63965.1 hypothetical protein CBR_g39970 [Chara braunii]